jgi:hypothetical protein
MERRETVVIKRRAGIEWRDKIYFTVHLLHQRQIYNMFPWQDLFYNTSFTPKTNLQHVFVSRYVALGFFCEWPEIETVYRGHVILTSLYLTGFKIYFGYVDSRESKENGLF